MDDSEPDENASNGVSIRLPGPEPVATEMNIRKPPPVWLTVGGETVQASCGEFCDLDVCMGLGTPIQLAENGTLAVARIPAEVKAFLIVGSGSVAEFSVGVRGWEYELADDDPRSGPMMPEADLLRMRRPDLRCLPEPEQPEIVLSSGVAPGPVTVYELGSTGRPGDRLLSVFLSIPTNVIDSENGGEELRNPASYHWRLDPGQPGENPPPPEREFPGELVNATITGTMISSYEEVTRELEVRTLESRPLDIYPSRVEAGEGYLWVMGFGSSEGSGAPTEKGDPAGEGGHAALAASAVPASTSGRTVLLKVDPESMETLFAVESIEGDEMSAGAGAVWAFSLDQTTGSIDYERNQLVRIDLGKGKISSRMTVQGGVSGLAAGGGSVWVSNIDGEVSKVDPQRAEIESTTSLPGHDPYLMELTPTALWVADADTLTRIDARSGRATGSLKTGEGEARDLTTCRTPGEETVWTVGSSGGEQEGRLTRLVP